MLHQTRRDHRFNTTLVLLRGKYSRCRNSGMGLFQHHSGAIEGCAYRRLDEGVQYRFNTTLVLLRDRAAARS